ncbi:MAG: alanine:cation symporter family protein [Sandaracinaceae bacterium]|nr:alanine:cation symporter family protein [Sandaracinaceae bacterium]
MQESEIVRLVGLLALLALGIAGASALLALRFHPLRSLAWLWRRRGTPPRDPPKALGLLIVITAASSGAGAWVGAATAIALGGPGAMPWLWGFALCIASLRMVEVLLSRTNPPGQASGEVPQHLPKRLWLEKSNTSRVMAIGAALMLIANGTFGLFALHGQGLAEIAQSAFPESRSNLLLFAALIGMIFSASYRTWQWMPWVAALAWLLALGVALMGCSVDFGRTVSALLHSLEDATSGSAAMGAFSGALVSEILGSALIHAAWPIAFPLGSDGPLGSISETQSARAGLIPVGAAFLQVIFLTVLGLAFIGTGAFSQRSQGERGLAEVLFLDAPFESASQRREAERLWTGYLRIQEGRARARPLHIATERGMIDAPEFVDASGNPADFAARIEKGLVRALLVPDAQGTLSPIAAERIAQFRVRGKMLLRGGALVTNTLQRIASDLSLRLGIAAAIVLSSIACAAWGLALGRLSSSPPLSLILRFLPSLSFGLAGLITWPPSPSLALIPSGALALLCVRHIREASHLAKTIYRRHTHSPKPALDSFNT